MSRRFSFIKAAKSPALDDIDDEDDAESKVTVVPEVALPPPTLKYKRLDYYYSRWGKTWKYRVRCFRPRYPLPGPMSSPGVAEHESEGHHGGSSHQQSGRP